ncbi:hypothetical protein [Oribacterium sp. C9]|nr:hypothetical protein [Oribacterium sp. C9]
MIKDGEFFSVLCNLENFSEEGRIFSSILQDLKISAKNRKEIIGDYEKI